jgi:hypothetical protein
MPDTTPDPWPMASVNRLPDGRVSIGGILVEPRQQVFRWIKDAPRGAPEIEPLTVISVTSIGLLCRREDGTRVEVELDAVAGRYAAWEWK